MGRRTMGLAALVLMANATFASTAWACASAIAGAPAPSGHHADARTDAKAPGHDQGSVPVPHRAPCGTSSGLDCCGAMPCAVSLALATTVTASAPSADRADVSAPALLAPASPVTSPDPPPPKS